MYKARKIKNFIYCKKWLCDDNKNKLGELMDKYIERYDVIYDNNKKDMEYDSDMVDRLTYISKLSIIWLLEQKAW